MTPHLLGVAEIAAMLGVTRQRVNQLVRSEGFPAPEAELSAGRIWRRDAVERWVVANPHRATEAGEAAPGSSLAPDAQGVLLRAQEEARELRHNYLGTEHLLLACLSDAAPEVERRLAALGVERAAVLAEVTRRCPRGGVTPSGHIPLTPRSVTILTTATRLAEGAAAASHVARAIARVPDGIAAQVIAAHASLTVDRLAAELDRVLNDDGAADAGAGVDGDLGGAVAHGDSPAALSTRLDRVVDELREIRDLLPEP